MKLYLPVAEGESVFSWLNRLGQYHTGLGLAEFLKLIQVNRQDLQMGRRATIERVAAVTGTPMAELRRCTYEHVSDRLFRYQDSLFYREFLTRSKVSFCPGCLLESGQTRLNGVPQIVGQIDWFFNQIRTCDRHDMPLSMAPIIGHSSSLDVAKHAPQAKELERMIQTATFRKPSKLQNYVKGRLNKGPDDTWLGQQQIDLACRATEMLGACIEFGAHFSSKKMNEGDWFRAGQVGFEFTSQGEGAIQKALEQIYNRPQKSVQRSGPQAIFGQLYMWMNFNKSDKPVGPIKELLREFILDTFPVPRGASLLGKEVKQQRRHSVASLAAVSGVHRKTVKNALMKANMLPLDSDLPDIRCTFPAEPAERLIAGIKRAVPVAQVPRYLGCSRTHASLLLKAGTLKPVIKDSDTAAGRHKGVDANDLDEFLHRMRYLGRPVDTPSAGMGNIPQIARKCELSSVDIIALILRGEVSNIELLSKDLKFLSVLVEAREVASLLGAQGGEEGVTISRAAKELGVRTDVVRFLLRTQEPTGVPALRKCGQIRHMGVMRDLVDPVSLNRFRSLYRKLSEIDGFVGREPERLRSRLKAKGVHPVWDPGRAGAEFYRLRAL